MVNILSKIQEVHEKYKWISEHLNEKSRRIWAATEANSIGWGGISTISKATGIDAKAIRKGIVALGEKQGEESANRIRREGGGRKKLRDTEKNILKALESLINPVTRGDPESPLRWTCKSTYKLAEALVKKGYKISQRTVYNLLVFQEYSLQSNKKTKEGANHPDRDKQFKYINNQVKMFQKCNSPILSVDTKKKGNIGNYKNNGREYRKKKNPEKVNGHDFPNKKLGKVSPYGVYDIGKSKGWISVGIGGDTAAFAVNTNRSWWYQMGVSSCKQTMKILITADCGGSNGNKVRLWKVELQKLANELNKEIYVSHFPPGTSKWNKIEHRMFSYISGNWRGRPLITREAVVNLIANTKTKTGLEIRSVLDENEYETGIKVSDDDMNTINISEARFHGEWNYCISPN
ncbi:MAG: ISAzo13 family transposase [Planctomycetes bacterium]|nr:ISAzo13 family transposase [Planctomycetota bacterium]